jgi:hypothetical protein
MFDWMSIMDIPGLPTVISALIGFGIASIFRPLCKGPDCLVLRGPPVSDIRGNVYQFGKKCVEFLPKAVVCPKSGIVETLVWADFN